MPKGTVGHHLKVLERAGLVHVVRTRQVRALTEKYYGRVARLFVMKGDEHDDGARGGGLAAMMLRQAADEAASHRATTRRARRGTHPRSPDAAKRRRRFERRLDTLSTRRPARPRRRTASHGSRYALFRAAYALPPPSDDA